jgi:hypothetical protein
MLEAPDRKDRGCGGGVRYESGGFANYGDELGRRWRLDRSVIACHTRGALAGIAARGKADLALVEQGGAAVAAIRSALARRNAVVARDIRKDCSQRPEP